MIRPLEIGHRSETVRRANLSAIVREVHGTDGVSRSELGARTGLTRSAIRRLIGELVAAGLVHETPAEPSGAPGRPSPVVRCDPHAAVVLAMVVEVDSLAVAAVGLGGTILAQERLERARGHLAVEDVVEGLVSLASRQQAAAEPIDRLPVTRPNPEARVPVNRSRTYWTPTEVFEASVGVTLNLAVDATSAVYVRPWKRLEKRAPFW